jgi:DNA polymerase-1
MLDDGQTDGVGLLVGTAEPTTVDRGLGLVPVLIIDGSAVLYRNRYRLEKTPEPLTEYTLAAECLFAFIEFARLKPFERVYILFDDNSHQRRQALYPLYKKHRVLNQALDTRRQMHRRTMHFLHNVLPHLGFVSIIYPGIEADDVAHFLAAAHKGGVLVTEDKDWLLNLFPHWHVYFPRKRAWFSYDDLCTFVGSTDAPRARYLTYKSLLGDASDGVPGVPKIGKKRAAALIAPIHEGEQHLGEHQAIVERNWRVLSPFWAEDNPEIAAE